MRNLFYTEEAKSDIQQLNRYIRFECDSPLTAKRYLERLEKRILMLVNYADVFSPIPELSIEMGVTIRRLNFEKMAILYSIDNEYVIIHRIIPQKMIIY